MLLTKSKFLTGLKCPRCFWKVMHEKTTDEISVQEEQNIKQGIQVGELAKKLFKNGIDLSNSDFKSNIKATQDCLFLNYVLFEAGIQVDNLYARMDILIPNADESYNIVEVKSSTSVKDEHIFDVAFQKYVCEKSGVNINRCYILHINNSYIKQGELKLEQLFIKEDITDQVEEFYPNVPALIEELINIYNLPEVPEVNANRYLFNEYPCEFDSDCWSFLPKYNVSKIYRINKSKVAGLFRDNIFEIKNVPNDILNDKQIIQKESIINNKVYINRKKIRDFISELKYPLYYLDFETFSEAIPRFDESKSYMQVPFQYSLHVQYKDGRLEHYEFLHKNKTDPRKSILISMVEVLGDEGSIIVFNQSFEKSRLKELSRLYSQYDYYVNSILERIVDLLVPFSNFNYYNPVQNGSCSIKKVLPAVTGKSYEGMEIANGGDASTLYFKATFEDGFSVKEKEEVYSNLLKYCKLDTEGMVWIIDELKKLVVNQEK
ncbi:DUF2779 domain-containing protein [Clostridium chromiireducens]|uniref:DUF2779 domain-containing protein n=1 Tax=Clostridium chromiireducens TaxID=225345 RepID=A0A964RQ32_9CLOT|nr:DUF2779 domain-containing protein [Clostridium chromiireducens]MVX65924.1 DUF2779 domain-containing protein [Clostridium chromiireducens]